MYSLEQSQDFGFADKDCNSPREVLCSKACVPNKDDPTEEIPPDSDDSEDDPIEGTPEGNNSNDDPTEGGPTDGNNIDTNSDDNIMKYIFFSLSVTCFMIGFILYFVAIKRKRRNKTKTYEFHTDHLPKENKLEMKDLL